MVCKQVVQAFCLACAAILPFGWISCGGPEAADPANVPEVALKTAPLSGDTLMLGYAVSVTVIDTLLVVEDTKATDACLQLYGYPSLRPLCRFAVKGKGPGEVLGVAGYAVDGDSVRVYTSADARMLVYALSDLVQGEKLPARVVGYPSECNYASAFGKAAEGFVVGQFMGDPDTGRIRLIDGNGGMIGARYSIPYTPEEAEKVAPYGKSMITMLWQAAMAVDGDRVVLGTRLGDVLEIYDLKDSTKNRIVRGPGGPPEVGVSGNSITFGVKTGYLDIQIVGDRIYALYDGKHFERGESPDADSAKSRTLRIFDMEGRWLQTGVLDRPVGSFWLLPDGRTALATDPTAEYQLYTFELPE